MPSFSPLLSLFACVDPSKLDDLLTTTDTSPTTSDTTDTPTSTTTETSYTETTPAYSYSGSSDFGYSVGITYYETEQAWISAVGSDTSGDGQVDFFKDGNTQPFLTVTGGSGEGLAFYIAAPGDFNADGYRDWAVTAPTANNVYVISGAYLMNLTENVITTMNELVDSHNAVLVRDDLAIEETDFGWSVARNPVDIDGDGLDDLIVGEATNSPSIAIIYGKNDFT